MVWGERCLEHETSDAKKQMISFAEISMFYFLRPLLLMRAYDRQILLSEYLFNHVFIDQATKKQKIS